MDQWDTFSHFNVNKNRQVEKIMTSNSRSQGMTSPPPNQNTPTVPLSVYRELAGELQATQSQLDGLRQDNQHLQQENQTLRLEIKKLVQSVQRLDNTINNWDQTFSPPPTVMALKKGENRHASPSQEHWYTHQPVHYPVQQKTHHQEQEINGWFVIAALMMIVFTFSGIGFMVARPLMNQSGQN